MSDAGTGIFLSAAVTLLVAWIAIRAQRRRDVENHRRQKLEEIAKLAAAIQSSLADVSTAIPPKTLLGMGGAFVPESKLPKIPSRSGIREFRLLTLLWFPQLSLESTAFIGAVYDYRGALAETIARARGEHHLATAKIGVREAEENIRTKGHEFERAVVEVATGMSRRKWRLPACLGRFWVGTKCEKR